jgi:hypothetical protein
MAKFKLIRRTIDDTEADHVLELAHAGMSRKLIATEVYGSDRNGEPLLSSMQRVHHILRWYGVRCTDYRNGKNKLGRAMIAAIRREADVTEAIRTATKQMAAALKKTA